MTACQVKFICIPSGSILVYRNIVVVSAESTLLA